MTAWLRLICNSFGVAVAAVAAQLGLTEALGIVKWTDQYATDGADEWSATLTWVAFAYACSVLAGASVGRRAVKRPGRPDSIAAQLCATLTAAAGAAAAVVIVWLPAREATPPVRDDPGLVAVITAAAGIVAGIVVALMALPSPPVAGGARAGVAWIWLVGIGSAAAGLASTEPPPVPRLAVIDAPSVVSPGWWSGPYAMVGIAALVGLAVAGIARWGGAHRFGVAVCGLPGPLLVTVAYLIAGPGVGAGSAAQADAYRASLLAAAAGLVASVLVALPGRRAKATPAKGREYVRSHAKGRERHAKSRASTHAFEGEVVETSTSSPFTGHASVGGSSVSGSTSISGSSILEEGWSSAGQSGVSGTSASGSGLSGSGMGQPLMGQPLMGQPARSSDETYPSSSWTHTHSR